jgi:3-oxoacyl-[acyl-carrier-protein] synthase-3
VQSPFTSRFESLGVQLPQTRRSTNEVVGACNRRARVDLESISGVHERRVCSEGEDSHSLAVGAALDCLAHSRYEAKDLEMLISTSITKYRGRAAYCFEPALSLHVREAIGATRTLHFDVSNACAGMLTGVYILDDFIRRGVIRRGMVVSGEYITSLSDNAARNARTILSKELASLTLGDSGAAVILERAERGQDGITSCEFVTVAAHSDLCIGKPCANGPGASMYTEGRKLHRVAIESAPVFLERALSRTGIRFAEVDHWIPHQTSGRVIRSGTKHFGELFGGEPRHTVNNIEQFGNTSSTTHFLALYRYLQERRIGPGERVLFGAFASGVVVGALAFTMDELEESYGRDR